MRRRETIWYLEPLDTRTSHIISWEVGLEDECRDTLCADGKRRNFYRCRWTLVKAVLGSVEWMGLRVAVWRRQGNGLPERFNTKLFGRHKSALVRDAKKHLAEMIKKSAAS
jgi:hypothetical protein